MENDETSPEIEQEENIINEEVEETPVEEPTDADVEIDNTDWKSEALKYKAILNRNKEKQANAPRFQVKPEPKLGELSQTDMLAVLRAGVPDEDLEEVQDYARLKRITVSEALKAPLIKASLAEKEEQRKTAQATNTGASKRGTSKASDESLMSRAEKGEMPEGEEDIARLWKMRHNK